MRFTLNGIELNLTAGSIIHQDEVTNIRAKTLLVLKYLISHQDKIVTKQELISTIWHDVVVQEQVLVQSIKEIRGLLGSDVIKTYPRQGYQWTAELTQIEKTTNWRHKLNSPYFILAVSLFLLVSTFAGLQSFNSDTSKTQINAFKLAFLPVENDMPDDIHNWVPLEGMNYLSRRISQQNQFSVLESKFLLKRPTHLTDVQKLQHFSELQKQLALDLLIQTRLLGYPQDFQLQYSFYLKHSVERGVIFGESVERTFEQLVEIISQRYGNNFAKHNAEGLSLRRDFSNEAFARGIELYLKGEYEKAMPFFRTAIQVNPELLASRRYLAASSVNNGEVQAGIELMLSNIEQAQTIDNRREAIRSYLMIGVLLLNWSSAEGKIKDNLIRAQQYIEQANELAIQANDLLFTAYSYEELGKIQRLQGHYIQAISLLNKALSYHKKVAGNYSQTNTLIELARVAAVQHNFAQAQLLFNRAQDIAEKNGVATNKVWIKLAQADVAQAQGLAERANGYALQAMTIAKNVKNQLLVNRVSAWLGDNAHYEIN